MKQTAVEWLIDKYIIVGGITQAMVEQAKQMEKEQIINFAYYFKHEEFTKKELEQHFKKTFKSE